MRITVKFVLRVCAAVILAVGASSARAADVTGNWTAEMQGPGGDSVQIAFTFKQDGATLSGSVQGPQGDAIAITDGKVDGDKISFKVSFNGMTISHDGTINAAGDEIKLSTKADAPDFPAAELTLKRVKAPPTSALAAVPARLHAGI